MHIHWRLVLLCCLFFLAYSFVFAGSLTPTTTPAATGYTLNNIYMRLLTNATSSMANHSFSPSGVPTTTFHSLSEIYALIPTIDTATVLNGTSYLGIDGSYDVSALSNGVIQQGIKWGVASSSTGTLTPDGGTASTSDIFVGETTHVNDDWDLDMGTLTLACATSVFDGTANLVSGTYDGTGDGTNRWCITDSGSASSGDIRAGSSAWVDGVSIAGTLPTQTLSASSENVDAGYYATTTLSSVETDLTAANIKSGVSLFGIVGSVLEALGNASTADVLAGQTFSSGSASNLTGTMANQGQQTLTATTTNTLIPEGYHDGTGYCAGDADFLAANIKSGVSILGVSGSALEASGSASASDVLSGTTFSNSVSAGVAGTMTNQGQKVLTATSSNTTIPEGYHNGAGYCAGDADFLASNIKDGVDISGVSGTYQGTVPNIATCASLGYSCTGSAGDVCTCGNNGCVNSSNGSGASTYADICVSDTLAGLRIQSKEDGNIRASLSINLSCLLGACDSMCEARVCYIP